MDKKYIEIKRPLPLKDQETGITRMRGEQWTIDTSEPAVARELQRKKHPAVQHDTAGHYLRFYLPPKANTWRTLVAVLNPHQAENLPNGFTGGEGSTPKSPKVGEKSAQESTIEDGDNQ